MRHKTQPFIYDIADWSPEKGDTLTPEVHKQMVEFVNKHSPDPFSMITNAATYAFNGFVREYKSSKVVETERFLTFTYLCHAHWTEHSHPEYTNGFLNIFRRNLRPDVNKRFLEFLLSPTESPWKAALRDVVVIRNKNRDNFPIGILWTRTDRTDILVFTNLLIASRLLGGWGLDIVWDQLVKSGLSPRGAMALLTLFQWNDMSLTTGGEAIKSRYDSTTLQSMILGMKGRYSSDQPFNWKMDPKRVLNADPLVNDNKVLSSKTKPNPCNQIWDNPSSIAVKTQGERKDAWGLCDGLPKLSVDPGIIKEIQSRLEKGEEIDFSRKP